LTTIEAVHTVIYSDKGAMVGSDADKKAGERQDVASQGDPEKRIWHRPSLTKIPVKEIILASPGSFIDGHSGSEAT
jgi:hypothetical protein